METSEFFARLRRECLSELERKTGVTRQALHNARKTRNMKLDNLKVLARAMNLQVQMKPLTTEDNLLSSLVEFGVPVAHSQGGTFSLSQTVGEGLKASRVDGAYETFLPYLLIRNVKKLDVLALAAEAFQNKQVNALGYFTEMANAFSPNAQFETLLRLLKPAKNDRREFLVQGTKSLFLELFMKNSFALKWNLLVRGSAENHFERWKKWQASQESN